VRCERQAWLYAVPTFMAASSHMWARGRKEGRKGGRHGGASIPGSMRGCAHGQAVPRPLGHPGSLHTAVEPGRHGGVTEVVGPLPEGPSDDVRCEHPLPGRRPHSAVDTAADPAALARPAEQLAVPCGAELGQRFPRACAVGLSGSWLCRLVSVDTHWTQPTAWARIWPHTPASNKITPVSCFRRSRGCFPWCGG
jgi:hypothetical protein